MEEKRSIHSLRSGGRMNLTRPMSDMSYVDEEGNGVRGGSAGAGGGNNNVRGGMMATHLSAPSGYGGSRRAHVTNPAATSALVTDTYIRVEGQAYRVQKGGSSATAAVPNAAAAASSTTNTIGTRVRRVSDAQTQSSESSFVLTNIQQQPSASSTAYYSSSGEQCATNINSAPLPPPIITSEPPAGCVQVGVPSRGPSPILLAPSPQLPHGGTAILASPMQLTYGYDPSYCQYLGQAADGYQYELVRRPSIGPSPADLALPSTNHLLRRPSTGAPYPPLSPQPPSLQQQFTYSTENSFDSMIGPNMGAQQPPLTPVFIQGAPSQAPATVIMAQPLTPRHLHHPGSSSSSAAATPPQRPIFAAAPSGSSHIDPSGVQSAFTSTGGSSSGDGAGMPKLIHETSI
jgi:hypothetical protein